MAKNKIMIVEDEGIVALQIKTVLEQRGYEVVDTVPSGEEALARIGEAQPDLILMDMKLQGAMDGVEAADLIRKQHDVPVIFLTAHSDDKTVARAREATPYGYLLKPFNAQELYITAEITLHKHRIDREKEKLTRELKAALEKVKLLSGLLPICFNCKRIRNDKGYWIQIEQYISEHSEAEFSHGLCPQCIRELYPEISGKILGDDNKEAPRPNNQG